MSTFPFGEPAVRQVLRDDVHERLLDLLVGGHVKPGERLSIDGLARRLQVSPTPVREALATLENTGLVQRMALRGYRVAPPLTLDQLNELIDARKVVELAALRMAMADPHALAEDLGRKHDTDARVIAEYKLDQPPAPDAGFEGYRAYFKADWAFHEAILAASRNSYLTRVFEGLGFQTHRLRQTFDRGVLDAPDAFAEHAAVLEAVRLGDVDEAVKHMDRHLENVRSRSLKDQS